MRPLLVALLAAASGIFAQMPVNVIVLEPAGKLDTNRAEIEEKMPLYRRAADPQQYTAWLNNESAERALRLYREAYDLTHPRGGVPDYYVALVPGGNHAEVGFRLQNGTAVVEYPKQPYILLDAQPGRFETTLLHETGHMAMSLVAGGRLLDRAQMASLPHSTAALCDRTTAFTEGYAIHLETLAAHVNRDPNSRRRFHRERVQFGDGPIQTAEYFRHSFDLTSYSQNLARYLEVRENNYSFEAAFQGGDYLRVQLEKARDFATVRDANQLLQSEGFYASFFFLFATRGADIPSEAVITARERQFLAAMQSMFASKEPDVSSPWLLRFVAAYMERFPAEKAEIADALNDLSHGVFVDANASTLWRDHYLAALRIDRQKMNAEGLAVARKQWREKVAADPQVLLGRIGPEIPCWVTAVKVRMEVLGSDRPLQFDLNTVQPGILRMIPGIAEAEIGAWLEARRLRPFAGAADFRSRVALTETTLAAMRF